LVLGAEAGISREEEGDTEDYPVRLVDRPLLLFHRMFEIGLDASHLGAEDVYDLDGEVESFDGIYRFTALNITLDYGITSHWQTGIEIPYFHGKTGEAEGNAIGDVSANIHYMLTRRPKSFYAAIYLSASYPSGVHDPRYRTNSEGEIEQVNLVTGDPYFDLMPGVEFKWRIKNWAIEGWSEYAYRPAGKIYVQHFLTEEKDMDPGEGVDAFISGAYQVRDKLALCLDFSYLTRFEGEIDGEDAEDQMMAMIPGTRILYHIKPDSDLYFGLQYTAGGYNTASGIVYLFSIKSRF
jgi:hypothetical protein